jgi:hypothetical protein
VFHEVLNSVDKDTATIYRDAAWQQIFPKYGIERGRKYTYDEVTFRARSGDINEWDGHGFDVTATQVCCRQWRRRRDILKKTHFDLRVKWPLFLFDCNQNLILPTDFSKTLQY